MWAAFITTRTNKASNTPELRSARLPTCIVLFQHSTHVKTIATKSSYSSSYWSSLTPTVTHQNLRQPGYLPFNIALM